MRHHQHDAAGVGQIAQHRHHLTIQCRVQTRGRLVEDQQRGAGQQLQCHGGPLALAAGQPIDPGIGVLSHLQLAEHLRHHLLAILAGRVRRQSKFGGVHQGLIDGQLPVNHVILGHHADPGTQRGVIGVDVAALEGDGPAARVGIPRDQPRQGGLTGTGRADDRGQGAGPGDQ